MEAVARAVTTRSMSDAMVASALTMVLGPRPGPVTLGFIQKRAGG
jgi:hypothetical protein